MSADVLAIIVAGVPLLAVLIEWILSTGLSERHHSHHDTYVIAASLSHALVFSMIFMGVVGLALSWLCLVGVFNADRTVVLAFFATFLAVSFLLWLLIKRYRVATYDDRLLVTPFIGKSSAIYYKDIERMEWSGIRTGTGYRNLSIISEDGSSVLLWGFLDLDQILRKINRFDVLPRS